jgi:transcriptional regulator with XRE-family HTH domain
MTEYELMKEISGNIQYMMNDSRINQKQLSKYSGLTESAISRYVNGERMPTIPSLLRLAYAMCCEVTDLITWDGEYIE